MHIKHIEIDKKEDPLKSYLEAHDFPPPSATTNEFEQILQQTQKKLTFFSYEPKFITTFATLAVVILISLNFFLPNSESEFKLENDAIVLEYDSSSDDLEDFSEEWLALLE